MDTKNNGGPAFPNVPEGAGSRWDEWDHGMSLRDYFAAKAPITVSDAMLACGVTASHFGMLGAPRRVEVLTKLAELRGEYADAMLAERAK